MSRVKPGVVRKYLEKYAEPEARDFPVLSGQWDAVVCIPACQEEDSLLETLRQMATVPQAESALVIVVINGRTNAPEAVHLENENTANQIRVACGQELPDGSVLDLEGLSLCIVDRYTLGRRLPENQGVGLARKIAGDLALSLIERGVVRSPWIRCTDADVAVPRNYFSIGSGYPKNKYPSAFVYPFVHLPEGDAYQVEAMRIYEAYLHYYVAGLKRAGSPYAYHTIGSLISINATSYAVVRGFPKRQAGEDFYLLNKLAKVGCVHQLEGDPVRIRGRVSHRVPFGTGAAVRDIRERLINGEGYFVYNPVVFDALAVWIEALKEFSIKSDIQCLEGRVREEGKVPGDLLWKALQTQGAFVAAEKASRQVSGEPLLRRLMEWNDAFRTLKLIHTLRDLGLGEVNFNEVGSLCPTVE